jgi:hypothetical protein
MHRKTLQKVIDELNKPEPRLDYVKGILETIIESLPGEALPIIGPQYSTSTIPPPTTLLVNKGSFSDDEGALLEAETKAKLARITQNV